MQTSTNQYIKPLTTKINSAGNLEIGGCDMVDLAEKYSTPLYVYRRRNSEKYLQGL